MAVDTIGYHIPIRKSRLIPRQEQLVYEMAAETEERAYPLPKYEKEYHILSLAPELMCGLTRKERQLKQLLFMALDQLYSTKILPRCAIGIRNGRRKNTPLFKKCLLMKRGNNCITRRNTGGPNGMSSCAKT